MSARTLVAALLAGCVGFAWIVGARADGDEHDQYNLLTTIAVPGNLAGGFDISWADSEAGRYYLADRGTTSIDVIDTKHNTFLGAILLHAAGNGVVSIRKSEDEDNEDSCDRDELWVGDANSFVEVVNLRTKVVVADISTLGKMRADELAYDSRDEILVVANDRDPIPYLTFISTRTRAVLGMLQYPQVVFGTPATGHGLEQPVWNGKTRRFYISVPATATHPTGEVDEINPLTRTVTNVIPTTCSPAGLALVPGQR